MPILAVLTKPFTVYQKPLHTRQRAASRPPRPRSVRSGLGWCDPHACEWLFIGKSAHFNQDNGLMGVTLTIWRRRRRFSSTQLQVRSFSSSRSAQLRSGHAKAAHVVLACVLAWLGWAWPGLALLISASRSDQFRSVQLSSVQISSDQVGLDRFRSVQLRSDQIRSAQVR